MEKKVSIVVPIYNGEKFLRPCVEQLIEQTYPHIEIILVDDGSQDRSYAIMQELGAEHKNISLLKKENGGTASALNMGFDKCSGDYLTWVACDDLKYSQFVEKLVNALNESECEFAFSMFEEFADSNPSNRAIRNFARMQQSGIMYNFLNISYQYCITGICFMFTRRLKKICGPFDSLPGEDYIMGVKMGLLTDVFFVAEVLGAHVLHPQSLTVATPACTQRANAQVKEMLRVYG